MVVHAMDTKQEWEFEDLLDFLKEFKLEKEALEYYEVETLDDIYDSPSYGSDDSEIMYWLDVHFKDRYFFCDWDVEGYGKWKVSEVTKEGIIVID